VAPEFLEVYKEIATNGNRPVPPEQVTRIKEIILNRIIKNNNMTTLNSKPANLPVIREFYASSKEVGTGETFSLSWKVENANKLELYKNGAFYKTLEISQPQVELTGFSDGSRKQSSFQLIAYQDLAMAKSEPVNISLKENARTVVPKKFNPAWIIGALVIAAGLFFLVRYLRDQGDDPEEKETMVIKGVLPKILVEGKDSIITFYGTGFPEKNSGDFKNIKALLGDRITEVLPNEDGTFSVTANINLLKQGVRADTINKPITVIQEGKEIHKQTLTFVLDRKIEITDFTPKNFYKHRNIIFAGKNLDLPGITVEIKNTPCKIVVANEDTLVAELPEFSTFYSSIPVDVFVSGKNKFHETASLSEGIFDHHIFELIKEMKLKNVRLKDQ
jgi:hypothetical protein